MRFTRMLLAASILGFQPPLVSTPALAQAGGFAVGWPLNCVTPGEQRVVNSPSTGLPFTFQKFTNHCGRRLVFMGCSGNPKYFGTPYEINLGTCGGGSDFLLDGETKEKVVNGPTPRSGPPFQFEFLVPADASISEMHDWMVSECKKVEGESKGLACKFPN